MKFSQTSSKDGIIQNCESLCSLGDAGITGNTILLAKFTGWINSAYHKVVSAIIAVDKNWAWDDSNYTDLPRGTATLVSGQQNYTLPAATASGNASELLRVTKIAVLDSNSTPQERTLHLTTQNDADLNNAYPTAGLPILYKLVGNAVKMWPSPSSTYVTLASGLVVYFQRSFDEFVTTDTTQQPGFVATYHDLLQLDASAQYLLPLNLQLATSYMTLFNNRLNQMQEDINDRNDDNVSQLRPKHRNPR